MMAGITKKKLVCIISVLVLLPSLSACSWQETLTQYVKEYTSDYTEPEIVPTISQDLYVYGQLSEETKVVYDQIVQLLLDYKESAAVSTKDAEIAKTAYRAVLADHPEIFWADSYSITSHFIDDVVEHLEIVPNYNMSYEEREQYQIKIDDYKAQCLAGIQETDTDYQKAKYIYEYIIKNTDYNEASVHNQNICSVMAHHSSVCMGYARTMQYLLKEVGILSVTVSGDTADGSHAWNLVRLANEFYYIDPTWGDMRFSGEHALNLDVDYSYFAITTEELNKTHSPDSEFQLEECVANTCNYYVQEGLYLEEYNETTLTQIIQNRKSGDLISIKCANADIYQQLITYLLEDGHIYDFVDSDRVNYLEMPELNILTIQVQAK